MDHPTEQPKKFRPKFTSRKKVIVIGLISLFLLIGTTALVLKPTSYRPKAENEPNPQCRLVVDVAAAAPTQTPTSGPSPTPTSIPIATRTPTLRPTATRTPTLRPTATRTPTLRPTATSTVRPTSAPTSTPIKPTFTPTPTIPSLGCNQLRTNGTNTNQTPLTIKLGSSITLTANFLSSNYGLIRSGKVTDCFQRIVEGTDWRTLVQGYGGSLTASFTPPSTGVWVFEVNTYDSDQCYYMCSAGSGIYVRKEGVPSGSCAESPDQWQSIGRNCSTVWPNCKQCVTVTP